VTVTAVVNEDDFAWYVRMLGGSLMRVERQNPGGTWTNVGTPGEPIVAAPGQVFRVDTGTPGINFGVCNRYVVPEDCETCMYNAPRMVVNIERQSYVGIPDTSRAISFTMYCVADETISDAVRRDLNGCRGDGSVFNIAGSWVCLYPVGNLNGFDNRRGPVFGRCLDLDDECTDYLLGEYQLNGGSGFRITTADLQYDLNPD
jgi:hypothetical protein